MSESLSLHELATRHRLLERVYPERKAEIDALRERIAKGYAKIAETGYAADDPRVVKAQEAISGLEGDLVRLEKAIEIPWYVESVLLTIARDALNWIALPLEARIRVYMPGIVDVTVKLGIDSDGIDGF